MTRPRRSPAVAGRSSPRSAQRDQQVEREQSQRDGSSQRPERALRDCRGERLQAGAGVSAGRLRARAAWRRRLSAWRPFSGPYRPGGCCGETGGRPNSSAASPVAACGGGDKQPEPVQRLGRRQDGVSRHCGRTPADSATSRRSISTNRPDSGRFDQSALAVTWNSTIRPAPARRRVTSGVPSASVAQVWAASVRRGFGEHLPGHRHVRRNRAARRTASRAGTAPSRPAGSRTARRRAGGRRPAA